MFVLSQILLVKFYSKIKIYFIEGYCYYCFMVGVCRFNFEVLCEKNYRCFVVQLIVCGLFMYFYF